MRPSTFSNLRKTLTKIIEWHPHPGPQTEVLKLNEYEILYGGARGGGKTDAGLVWMTDYYANPHYRGLVLRKNANDLADWLDRASVMYSGIDAQIVGQPKMVRFPSGAILRTGHLKDRTSYESYLGHEYQHILVEELTQIPQEKYYIQILGSCRSTVTGIKPQILSTTNPGGVGHVWVKKRFVDPVEPMTRFTGDDTGRSRIFIPSTIDDNPSLLEKDPGYVLYLDGLKTTDPDLWKAWRHGDWTVFAGQVFREFNIVTHVRDDVGWSLEACRKILCFDWGYNAPGCAIWLAVTPENKYGVKRVFAYRELYQSGKTPEQWAEEIKVFTKHEKVQFMVLPHDCFSEIHGEQTIAETFRRVLNYNLGTGFGTMIVRGKTLEARARLNRKAIMHQMLSIASDGFPYLILHPSMRNTIRSLPELVYDESNPEDINSESDDHAYDALSLGLLTVFGSPGQSGAIKPHTAPDKPLFIPGLNPGTYRPPDIFQAIKEATGKPRHKNWETR